jgi:hypothetical protein
MDTIKKIFDFQIGNNRGEWCGKVENLKHFINCCTNKLSNYTNRHNNIGKIVAEAMNIDNPQISLK